MSDCVVRLPLLNVDALSGPPGRVVRGHLAEALRLTDHAIDRMRERGVTEAMVRLVIRNGQAWESPEAGVRVGLRGCCCCPVGEDLTLWRRCFGLVVTFEPGGWIPTVFWGEADAA